MASLLHTAAIISWFDGKKKPELNKNGVGSYYHRCWAYQEDFEAKHCHCERVNEDKLSAALRFEAENTALKLQLNRCRNELVHYTTEATRLAQQLRLKKQYEEDQFKKHLEIQGYTPCSPNGDIPPLKHYIENDPPPPHSRNPSPPTSNNASTTSSNSNGLVPSQRLVPGQFLVRSAKDVSNSVVEDCPHPPPAPTIQHKLHPFNSTYMKVQDNYQTNQGQPPLRSTSWNGLAPSRQSLPGQFLTCGAKDISKYPAEDELHPSVVPTIQHKPHPPHPTYVEMQDLNQTNQQGQLPTQNGKLVPPPYSNVMPEKLLAHSTGYASKPILTTTELPFLSSPSLVQCNPHLSGSTYVIQDYHQAHQWGQPPHIDQPSMKASDDIDGHIATINVPSPQPTPFVMVNRSGCHMNGAQLVNGNGNSNYRYPPSMMLRVGTPCQPGTKGKMLLPLLCQEAC